MNICINCGLSVTHGTSHPTPKDCIQELQRRVADLEQGILAHTQIVRLEEGDVIYHLNGDINDNSVENVVVMRSSENLRAKKK